MSIVALDIVQLQVVSALKSALPPDWKTNVATNEDQLIILIYGLKDPPTDRKLLAEVFFDNEYSLLLFSVRSATAMQKDTIIEALKASPLDLPIYQIKEPK
jgi:hypothetical protein